MSLYNMIFGRNPLAPALLGMLDLTPEAVGRFRDCFVSDGTIAVYTRNGGGNRENHQDVFDALSAHSCYLRDEDDDFDSTYATIYFSFPPRYAELLAAMNTGTFNPSQRWIDYIDAIKQPDYQPPAAVSELMDAIAKALKEQPSAEPGTVVAVDLVAANSHELTTRV